MAESLPGTRHLKNDASATNGSRSVAIVSEGRQPREIHVADLRRREGPRRYRAGAMLREVYGARARQRGDRHRDSDSNGTPGHRRSPAGHRDTGSAEVVARGPVDLGLPRSTIEESH